MSVGPQLNFQHVLLAKLINTARAPRKKLLILFPVLVQGDNWLLPGPVFHDPDRSRQHYKFEPILLSN